LNYIGSKLKLSSWIKDEIIHKINDNLSNKVFCDIFAGTGIIGRTFKKDVKQVISNDLEYFSYILNRNYIQNSTPLNNKDEFIQELNNLPLINSGFIYQNYCLQGRKYFTDFNCQKIDTIRIKIEEWKEKNIIDEDLYFFLLASLIESADKVANTASVYGSFLKHFKKSASQNLVLKGAEFIQDYKKHAVFNEDSNQLIKKINGDILYLDPPYNQRQYGANYHLLNTIAKYQPFTPKGKTGLPKYNRSTFSQKNNVLNSFEELIKNAKFQYIFLSYNNEGLLAHKEIQNIMEKYGKYELKTKKYQRFKANKNRTYKQSSTLEFLHILEKY
jgi:adenine-specific DNA-methyltransferase